MKRVKSNWSDVILVCRKCSKKLHGGFGAEGDEKLSKLLKKEVARAADAEGKHHKGRKAPLGVIEVGCLDICPKGAVVTVRAGAPREWVVVPRGTPAPVVLARLGLEAGGGETQTVASQPSFSVANISPISASLSKRHSPG